MFQVGDTVIYTTYGLCRIDDRIQKEFNGQMMDYFILKPLNDQKASLQIQVDNPLTLEKLRSLLKKDEILKLIQQMPLVEPYWIDNDNERKRHFSQILRCGQRIDIIGIIVSVIEHHKQLKEKGRKLHAADEQSFKDAEKIIYEEFAYVLDIDMKDVPSYIDNLITQK